MNWYETVFEVDTCPINTDSGRLERTNTKVVSGWKLFITLYHPQMQSTPQMQARNLIFRGFLWFLGLKIYYMGSRSTTLGYLTKTAWESAPFPSLPIAPI